MRKRCLSWCIFVLVLGVLTVPGAASAQRIDYALRVVTPSAPPRTTFPYLGVVPPGHLSGSPLVLANNVGAPQQQWLALCLNHPGNCDIEGSPGFPFEFDPPGVPPIKLFQRFSGLCLTRPNDTGNGTRPVMSPCTTARPTHYRQMWVRYSRNPNTVPYDGGLTVMRGSMFIAELGDRPHLRCLDITEFKNVPGTAIQLWTCTGGWNQRFSVITVRTH